MTRSRRNITDHNKCTTRSWLISNSADVNGFNKKKQFLIVVSDESVYSFSTIPVHFPYTQVWLSTQLENAYHTERKHVVSKSFLFCFIILRYLGLNEGQGIQQKTSLENKIQVNKGNK